jgi:MFS family permease
MTGGLGALLLGLLSLPLARWLSERPGRAGGGRVLAAASLLHLTNDAAFAILYPLLPIIAVELSLSYTEVGLVKAVFSGASSALQLPVGLLAERFGLYRVLVLGNAWVGAGLLVMALAGGYLALLAAALLAGLGGNAQHPLAAALVSRSVPVGRVSRALGTLNFIGDLGKLIGPLLVGGLAPLLGWRPVLAGIGAWTLLLSLTLLVDRMTVPLATSPPAAGAALDRRPAARGFAWLLVAGALDNATRGAALTFLPFLVQERGLAPELTSLLFGLLFAAGAAGKFACGWLGDRWGAAVLIVVTELVTAACLLGFLVTAPLAALPLALLFGFMLNGTSSPLTAAVAQLVAPERRAWAYGAYFTVTLVSSALAPFVYGLLADRAGLTVVFVALAGLTAAIAPLVLPIRRGLRPAAGGLA